MSLGEIIITVVSLVATFLAGAWLSQRTREERNINDAKDRALRERQAINDNERLERAEVDRRLGEELENGAPTAVDRFTVDDALDFFRGEGAPPEPKPAPLPESDEQ